MSRIAVLDARKDLAAILNRAAYGKERVVLTRRGKDVAAIVPMDDLNTLEAMEDHMDLAESERILSRVRAGSESLVSLDAVKAKYKPPSAKGSKTRPKAGKGSQCSTNEATRTITNLGSGLVCIKRKSFIEQSRGRYNP